MDAITDQVKRNAGRLVHEISAHSYFVYLIAIVIGFGLDELFPQTKSFLIKGDVTGFTLIVLGTLFVVWARATAHRTQDMRHGGADKTGEVTHYHFHVGPYCITRAPTQLGLFVMTLGLSLLYHSVFMTVCTLVAFLISRFVFVPEREKHLVKKYGQAFSDYKQKVHF